MRQRSGFTLVELSIVLVIIGLLTGGILVAQSMISTARILAQIRQLQQYDTAFQNFKTSYNRLPGEQAARDNCGSSNWGICVDGFVGNNRLDTACCDNHPGGDFRVNYFEGLWSFIELRQYDLISEDYEMWASNADASTVKVFGKGNVLPTTLLVKGQKAGILPLTNASGQLFWFLAIPPAYDSVTSMGYVYFAPSGFWQDQITPIDAVALDAKIDDGLPGTGGVVAVYGGTPSTDADYYPINVDTHDGACISGGKYNTALSTPQCNVLVKGNMY